MRRKTEKNAEGFRELVERERLRKRCGHLPALKWKK